MLGYEKENNSEEIIGNKSSHDIFSHIYYTCYAMKIIDDFFEKLDKDEEFNKYPRFKIKDDASVVFAKAE